MIPLATNGAIGQVFNGTIGRVPNARFIHRVCQYTCIKRANTCVECIILLSKIYPACHLDANEIKPGSDQKTTDNHAAKQ